jgi:hypothetical protein
VGTSLVIVGVFFFDSLPAGWVLNVVTANVVFVFSGVEDFWAAFASLAAYF